MLQRYFFYILLCWVLSFSALAEFNQQTDMIWVQKSGRLLHLIRDYQIVGSYPIQLGKNPSEHKQVEGDSRTPEGLYFIDGRNPDSQFFLSLHISYPSFSDWRRAMHAGVPPGGQIMIHGEPNDSLQKARLRKATSRDWTDGCIAVNDADMAEIWHRVKDGTPILIDP